MQINFAKTWQDTKRGERGDYMVKHGYRKSFFSMLVAFVLSVNMSAPSAAFAAEIPGGYREIMDAGGIGVSTIIFSADGSDESGGNQGPNVPVQNVPKGYFEVTIPGGTAVSDVILTAEPQSEEYDYTIRIHYEDFVGNEKIESYTKSAAFGSKLPWEAEKLPSRKYDGKNYVLAGFSAINAITRHPERNVADLYYAIDVNDDGIPDKYQNSDGTIIDKNLYNYTITYDYNQGAMTELVVLHDRPVGSIAIDRIEPFKEYGVNGETKRYAFSGVDTKSVFVTPTEEDNVATIYYMPTNDESPEDPGGDTPGGEDHSTPGGVNTQNPGGDTPGPGNGGNPDPGNGNGANSGPDDWTDGYWPGHRPIESGHHHDGHTNSENNSDNNGGSDSNANTDTNAGTEDAADIGLHMAYIEGYPDGTVGPQKNITRAEVAMICYRLMEKERLAACHSSTNWFSDVAADDWHNTAVSTMLTAGIITGYQDGSFRPDNNITRAEFAAIISRFLRSGMVVVGGFPDVQDHWARNYITSASAAGWIEGYPDGTFKPDAYITRAEAVTIFNRALGRAPDARYLLGAMKLWTDNSDTSWYYADIQEATNSHTYNMDGSLSCEIWHNIIAG